MGVGLDWFVEHQDMVHHLCRRACPTRQDIKDELVGVCAVYVENIASTYKGKFGATLTTHMVGNLRWYVYKWVKKYFDGRQTKNGLVRDLAMSPAMQNVIRDRSSTGDRLAFEAGEEVQVLRERVGDYYVELLLLRHGQELTFRQIGAQLGCSRTTASKRYGQALAAAREATQ